MRARNLDKSRAKHAFGIALTTSLAIHAGVVLGYVVSHGPTYGVALPNAISVDIVTPQPGASPGEVQPAVFRPAASSARPRNRPRPSAAVQLAPVIPPPEAQPAADVPHAPLVVLVAPTSESAPEALHAVAGAGSPTATTAVLPTTSSSLPPAVVAASATHATAVAEITRRLRSAAASCYPYAAVRSNIEGTTSLRFCIGDNGEPRDVRVVNSSGSAILDNATVDCVLPSAMPFPAISRPCVTVPVRFELQR